MIRGSLLGFVGLFVLMESSSFAQDASLGPLPRVLDDRLKLELFAEHPMLVTPTGIDVDPLGRVWALESNTHFPPEGYQGHPSDRLLVLQDTDGDGKADKTTVFADGFKFAMSVVVQPVWLDVAESLGLRAKGQNEDEKPASSSGPQPLALSSQPVFVATRGEIVRLRDTNNDLVTDERTRLVHLETAGNYPHNGLAGIAFDALGWMYFGFGENLGADYKIIGSDGVTLSGGGEGGNMYRCRPDGSKLEKWATGFWNPHASCFDAFGRLFTVDNDPDSRPPCRLLHIIPGGDYGYRFRNGRRGTHPFTAWNGEIPGTLPMVSGTGEAPSGIVCYESDGFPADYLGTLLVGSWGDHRIDQFVLEPKGASFVSKPKPIVQGTENFRPVGLALAPDGSVYFSDWVLRDYKLHRKGRVWRLSAKDNERLGEGGFVAGWMGLAGVPGEAIELALSRSLPVRRLAARRLAADDQHRKRLLAIVNDGSDPHTGVRARVEALWALSQLPRDVVDLKFVDSKDSPVADWPLDEVRVVAAGLFQTPQFELRPYGERHPLKVIDLLSALRKIKPPSDPTAPSPTDFLAAEMATRYYASPVRQDEFRKIALLFRLDGTSFGPHADSALITSMAFDAREGKWDTDQWEHLIDSDSDNRSTASHSRLLKLLAARIALPQSIKLASLAIRDRNSDVRRLGIQWIGEEKLHRLRSEVDSLLSDTALDPSLVMPCLASLSLLDGVPPAEFEKTPPVTQLMKIVADDKRPAALRATALQMVPASTAELSTKLLLEFAKSGDVGLKTQAVRTLQQSGRADGIPLLLEIAADENAETSLRLDAIAGLCATPHDQPLPANIEQFLLDAVNNRLRFRAASEQKQGQLEAIRALRGRGTAGSKVSEALRAVRETASGDRELVEALDLAINGKSSSDPQPSTVNSQPSPDSGRRVFYHHQGALCFKCHTVNGRGGNVGPDLSVIARTMNREKLLGSILEPSKEISPQFLTWTISTVDGKTHSGIIVTENGGGDIELGDAQGNITKIPRKEIEERTPSNVSVMPQGLPQRMTSQELADLLDYLETLK